MFISFACAILVVVATWFIYKKMGREGWEAIVPFYNNYVLCEDLYGDGWKFLYLLIPFYNIYFMFKLYIDWAHSFNKESGFGVGMVLLSVVFIPMLAFGDAQYVNAPRVNMQSNFAARPAEPVRQESSSMEKILQLKDLKDQGIITEEEFEAKKEELLKKI